MAQQPWLFRLAETAARRNDRGMKWLAAVLVAASLACGVKAADKPDAKKAHLTSIPGIAETMEAKLNAAGINNVNDLLAEGATRQGRDEIAARSGIAAEEILRFVHAADLLRIKGITGKWAALLAAAGLNTVSELAERDAPALQATLLEVNTAKKLTAKLPAEQQLAEWIAEAKTLPKVVTD